MKKTTLALFAFLLAITVQAQDLDEIIKNHFEAIGQENLLAHNNMKTTGKMIQGGMEIPVVMYASRPLKVRMEATLQGQSIITAYDGESGWMINPMMGTLDPQDMDPEAVKNMKEMADIDGELYNYEEKGHSLEYIGTEEIEGTETYHLKLTKKSGDISNYFLDTETYIILKLTSKNLIQGVEVESGTIMSNYQIVDGIAIPYSIATEMNGQVVMEIVIEETEFDVDIPEGFFSKPLTE